MDRKTIMKKWLDGYTNMVGWMEKRRCIKKQMNGGWIEKIDGWLYGQKRLMDGWMYRKYRWMVGCIEKIDG